MHLRDHYVPGTLCWSGILINVADPGPRKCNGDSRNSVELDGISIEHWHELLAIWRALPIGARSRLLDYGRKLRNGVDSLNSIGLGKAIEELETVVALNSGKHPGEKWRQYSFVQHVGKAMKHGGEALYGTRRDGETKRLHLAHSAIRLVMATAVSLLEDERR